MQNQTEIFIYASSNQIFFIFIFISKIYNLIYVISITMCYNCLSLSRFIHWPTPLVVLQKYYFNSLWFIIGSSSFYTLPCFLNFLPCYHNFINHDGLHSHVILVSSYSSGRSICLFILPSILQNLIFISVHKNMFILYFTG